MDAMDLDLDVGNDVDLVADEPIVAEADPRERSPGEVDDDPDARVPTKVHIQGLDILNPAEVKAYVAEHVTDNSLERIEWIDDSTANLLFASEAAASSALVSLAADPIPDPSQLLPRTTLQAKPFSTKPGLTLQVRPALASDKKQAGAAQRSRFYLLNPEYDPEQRRRTNESRRYRDRDYDDDHRQRRRRRSSVERNHFDVNLYDDSVEEPRGSRRPTRDSYRPGREDRDGSEDALRNENRGKELFPEGSTGSRTRARDRSASPTRSYLDEPYPEDPLGRVVPAPNTDSTWARRNRNMETARKIKSQFVRKERVKELFPDRSSSDTGRLGDQVEDAAELLRKGITLPLMDDNDDAPGPRTRRLEDRITAPGHGRLADRISSPASRTEAESAFSIRGAASQRSGNQGFAIKGNAGKTVKELFPDKFGSNAGKELFAEPMEGRTRRRQRAGDLFD
ncbi:hypothetical protein F4780DRAFT_772735 [Xylariomycetidae sp. FL0641]|nr:hypothetical protein F4780DRAFT_772735 [Xylariomycetidae sp. FL0641]